MFFLVASILLSTVFGQIMKWAVVRGCSTTQVAAVNYFVAMCTAAVAGVIADGLHFDPRILAIGVLGGVSYAIAIVAIFIAIRRAGIAITGALMRMAVVVPILGGVLLFKEIPSAIQWLGIILTLLSFILLRPAPGLHPHRRIGWATLAVMLFVVLSNGTGFLSWKMVHVCGCGQQILEYLCLLFGLPMLTCAAESVVRREQVTRAAIGIGVLLGITNVTSGCASLAALRTMPAVIFFPIYSCGGVLLNVATARILWGERLSRLNLVGIAIGCLALVCMSPK